MTDSFDSRGPRSASVQCVSPSGLHRMAYSEWGDPRAPRTLLCIHALTRTGRDFDVLARRFAARGLRVVCPDVVGRGQSDWLTDPSGYAVQQYVADMVTLIARLDVDEVEVFGTSMGGMIGMVLAALPKTPVKRLLLNDIGPRIEAPALARIGTYLGKSVHFATEAEGYAYLSRVAAEFGPHTDEQWRALNAAMLRKKDDGYELHYDPKIAVPFAATTKDSAAAGQEFLWRCLEAIEAPTLVVRGANSDLLSPETVTEMRARGKRVTSAEVPGVGHAPTFVHESQLAIADRFFGF